MIGGKLMEKPFLVTCGGGPQGSDRTGTVLHDFRLREAYNDAAIERQD